MRIQLTVLLALCVLSIKIMASPYQWDDVDRVVAVGDVHGAYPELVSILQAAQVVDTDLSWTGGKTHLVSLGDLLDRGPQSALVMDLLMRLQDEAQASGGYVHVVLGNHEVMNLSGDLRDVSEAEYQALEPLGGHERVFALDGHYGRWLATLPFVIRINDSVFAHGGFATILADATLEQINTRAHDALSVLLNEGKRLREAGALPPTGDLLSISFDYTEEQLASLSDAYLNATRDPLLGDFSPQWYRGTALCHALLEEDPLTSTLQSLGAKRAIVGHTPTRNREVNARFAGKAYIIDTGMLRPVYKGRPRGIEITAGTIRAFGPDGTKPITRLPKADPDAILSDNEYTAQQGDDGVIRLQVSTDRKLLPARFIKLNKKNRNRAVAAYRLDRLLGLDMIPTTVAREVNGRDGIVVEWHDKIIPEQSRVERNLTRLNYCEKSSDYSLLAVFDALIGKLDRDANNLLYDPATWQIRLAENHKAFGNKTTLPQYSTPPQLSPQLADALKELSADKLSISLAGLLKSAEIRALLKRRDKILTWPVSSN